MIEAFGYIVSGLIDAADKSTFGQIPLASQAWLAVHHLGRDWPNSGADPDFHAAICLRPSRRVISPAWEFSVQLFHSGEADKFPFDHLDATKADS